MTNNSFLENSKTITINEKEHLTKVFKRNGYPLNAIPPNCIFDKTRATRSRLNNCSASETEPIIPLIVA